MNDASQVTTQLNIHELGSREIGNRLRTWDETAKSILLTQAMGEHCLAAGISAAVNIQVEGNLGDYAFAMLDAAEIEIRGNVSKYAGHSMHSGSIQVHGHVGDGFGAFASGGFLATIGRGGNRCGLALAGADVIIRSDCGDEAGMAMTGGSLVLGNSVGQQLGLGMTGGAIFARGQVGSLAEGVRETRLKDADALRLSLLLVRAGIRAAAKEFRCYRPMARSTE